MPDYLAEPLAFLRQFFLPSEMTVGLMLGFILATLDVACQSIYETVLRPFGSLAWYTWQTGLRAGLYAALSPHSANAAGTAAALVKCRGIAPTVASAPPPLAVELPVRTVDAIPPLSPAMMVAAPIPNLPPLGSVSAPPPLPPPLPKLPLPPLAGGGT